MSWYKNALNNCFIEQFTFKNHLMVSLTKCCHFFFIFNNIVLKLHWLLWKEYKTDMVIHMGRVRVTKWEISNWNEKQILYLKLKWSQVNGGVLLIFFLHYIDKTFSPCFAFHKFSSIVYFFIWRQFIRVLYVYHKLFIFTEGNETISSSINTCSVQLLFSLESSGIMMG